MNALDTFLWGVLPYIFLTTLIVGYVWRFKTDQYGWTSRSSQVYESKILKLGSPLFHFGIIFVFFGHVAGVLIPKAWTQALGISEHAYHLGAVVGGAVAGLMAVAGLVILLIRRFTTPAVARATSTNDKIMYTILVLAVALGAFATVSTQILGGLDGGYDYRESIGPWMRSVLAFHPDVALMAGVPMAFKLHIVAGMLLIGTLPFTRLVHMGSAPVMYPTRPYVVYRSREGAVSSTPDVRGWAPVRATSSNERRENARAQGA